MTRLLLLLTFISTCCFSQNVEGEADPVEIKNVALSYFENLVRRSHSGFDRYNKVKLTVKGTYDDPSKIFTEIVNLSNPSLLYKTETYRNYICDTLLHLGKKCYETVNQFDDFVLTDLYLLAEGKVVAAGDTLKAKKLYSDGGITRIDYIFNAEGLPIEKIAYYGKSEKALDLTNRTVYLNRGNKIAVRIDSLFEKQFVYPTRVKLVTERYYNKDQNPEKVITKDIRYEYGKQIILEATSAFRYDSEGRIVYYAEKMNGSSGRSLTVEYDKKNVTIKTYFSGIKGTDYYYELLD
jgi:hypothetical protein